MNPSNFKIKENNKLFYCFFLLCIFGVQNLQGITTIYTGANGDWTGHIWSLSGSGAPLCSGTTCSPACNFSGVANIKHKVTVTACSGLLTISGGGAVNLTGSTSRLSITGNLSVTGGSTVLIPASDTLYVSGNVDVSSTSTITVNGYISIGGNVNTSGSSSICGTGSGTYAGSLTGPIGTPGWCFALSPVPIQLINFHAEFLNDVKNVKTTWVTASEINNHYFMIERSFDGENFEAVGKVFGAGNSNQYRDYDFYDQKPIKGISYYRLRQVDYDGHATTYSKVPVNSNTGSNALFVVYPNPNNGRLINLIFSNDNANEIIFNLSDIYGRIIFQKSIVPKDTGTNSYQLIVDDLIPEGIYFFTGYLNKESITQKFIVNNSN